MRGRRIVINILISVLVAAMIIISFFSLICIVFNFTHIKSDVNQLSMYPTLNASITKKDIVYINKFKPVMRGDIVVADVLWNDYPIIKRVVALPNDSIYMLEGQTGFEVYVNDSLFYTMPFNINSPVNGGSKIEAQSTREHYNLFNNYLSQHSERTIIEGGITKLQLKANEYFVLGDNWILSEDSTTQGPILDEEILGSVDVVIHANENRLNMLIYSLLKGVFSI